MWSRKTDLLMMKILQIRIIIVQELKPAQRLYRPSVYGLDCGLLLALKVNMKSRKTWATSWMNM